MAMNPMQRKARNSFLLGMLLMLVIAAIAVAIIFVLIILPEKRHQQTVAENSKTVYMLKRTIKSGEAISASDLSPVVVETNIDNGNIAKPSDIKEEETIAKIDLAKGIVLSQDMLTTTDETIRDDIRIEEYNMILLPTDLDREDYVDIRIMYPNGLDLIVASKKRVTQLSSNTIFLKMSEDEIMTVSSAIVDAWWCEGAYLYAVKYDEPGMQKAATVTYQVRAEVGNAINSDPNVVAEAKNALNARYNTTISTSINQILANTSEDAIERIKDGVEEKVQKQQEETNRYIESMSKGSDY